MRYLYLFLETKFDQNSFLNQPNDTRFQNSQAYPKSNP
ncbi:hypothetical protein LEP1GSC103_3656 [Leptospira borgpetersenii serovar Javanica str. UI 09931]|uniref:Uncharacterized protein n=4 Tax=Leptospira borgpetersenii TaxID=174 RepID=A0A0S2INP0_LEPBO|nr:hypothetical protein LBBP_00995 [Leptospira borgpetersenii serovar Ballum]EKP13798.1 hypothetical protein LEP1GSC128_0732 [Leptospira borgpetersenii str. 200801926]EKQ93337.1 hypothetical protein LEP1GSC101_3794 [Leptospira borgpetersenii str. UI 09149]EKQ98372.1 hypothetical protein LEP1GSC121_3285 [Leptospira borgpetersenii serovar Castellonis str. 200801910]EMK09138.1 hypothetical protein LEP1GSC066_0208 [Leptospira sp. serovar Kenya str. Sh9]EMN15012.1 hypothetical protein LEP1GSC055_16